jgi:hypothetical protein
LDALIQENAQVPVSTIVAIAPRFPAQAAILISRLPLSESRSTLGDWTLNNGGSWASGMLARIALMMLAKDPELKGARRVNLLEWSHAPWPIPKTRSK